MTSSCIGGGMKRSTTSPQQVGAFWILCQPHRSMTKLSNNGNWTRYGSSISPTLGPIIIKSERTCRHTVFPVIRIPSCHFPVNQSHLILVFVARRLFLLFAPHYDVFALEVAMCECW